MSVAASQEAMRIVRSLDVDFPNGPGKTGSAFVEGQGKLITCAHVVTSGNQTASRIIVKRPDKSQYEAHVSQISKSYDLARLSASAEVEEPPSLNSTMPPIGTPVVFAGLPQGVAALSVFPGMISNIGSGLISQPRCEVIQISGMINSGNSGGPLLDATDTNVIGVLTAKTIPLLKEIDKLQDVLGAIPQLASDVGLGTVDFAKFVNLTIGSMWQLAAVLRLVQVGTGWAVPVLHLNEFK